MCAACSKAVWESKTTGVAPALVAHIVHQSPTHATPLERTRASIQESARMFELCGQPGPALVSMMC